MGPDVRYCIDPRHYELSSWGRHPRCGPYRSQLLAESLEALADALRAIGSRLTVFHGRPEEVALAAHRRGSAGAAGSGDAGLCAGLPGHPKHHIRVSYV